MATIKVSINETQSNFLARTTAPDKPKDLQQLGWATDEYIQTGNDSALRKLYSELGK